MEHDGEQQIAAQLAQEQLLATRLAERRAKRRHEAQDGGQAMDNRLFYRVTACIEQGPMSLGFGGFNSVVAGVHNNLIRGTDLDEGVVTDFRDGIVYVNQEQFNELVNAVNLWQQYQQ